MNTIVFCLSSSVQTESGCVISSAYRRACVGGESYSMLMDLWFCCLCSVVVIYLCIVNIVEARKKLKLKECRYAFELSVVYCACVFGPGDLVDVSACDYRDLQSELFSKAIRDGGRNTVVRDTGRPSDLSLCEERDAVSDR